MFYNVPALGEVANFGTNYFLLKIKFLAKCKREFTTKFAILPNACYGQFFYLQCSVIRSFAYSAPFSSALFQFSQALFLSFKLK
jgi:hypothetical protein